MYMYKRWEKFAFARKWFLLGLIFAGLFLVLTVLYATGIFDMATLLVERWIIGRPLTQFDCVLVKWRDFGAVSLNLVIIVLVGVICGLTRYRWRVLAYLLLLMLLGLAAEGIDKFSFALSYPPSLHVGMSTLSCPQVGYSQRLRVELALGMWWKAPLPSLGMQNLAHTISQMPINTSGYLTQDQSYPSGHAIRWWFTGLLLAWLAWKHIRRDIIRWPLVVLVVLLSFLGAAIQFYLGNHFVLDTFAGYLLGTALACFAIGLLMLNEKKKPQTLAPGGVYTQE